MKYNTNFFTVLIALLMFFAFNDDALAQRKKNKVKRHVKTHHKRHFRPVKARRAAHYRYRHLPRRGKIVRRIGVGGVRIGFRGLHFHFHNGVWYRPHGKRFITARAPLGIRVRVLPLRYRRLVIGPRPYFYHYGTFYIKVDGPEEEYEVVAAPIGAEVDGLPDGYKIVKERGVEYYKLDDVFYEPRINENNEEYYVVVKDPTQ
ncbi:MAG: DUF6515 family protein [Aurantibacter sp.]